MYLYVVYVFETKIRLDFYQVLFFTHIFGWTYKNITNNKLNAITNASKKSSEAWIMTIIYKII